MQNLTKLSFFLMKNLFYLKHFLAATLFFYHTLSNQLKKQNIFYDSTQLYYMLIPLCPFNEVKRICKGAEQSHTKNIQESSVDLSKKIIEREKN